MALAQALGIRDLSVLTGTMSVPVRMFAGPGHPNLPEVQAAINNYPLRADGPPPSLRHLRARLDAAWRARHAAPDHRTVLGGILPALITDAQAAIRLHRGEKRRRAQALLAEVFNLAQFFLAYQPAVDLLWRAAERGMAAAQESGDPLAVAGAIWLLVQAHRDVADFNTARAVNEEGAELLRPHIADGDPNVLAMYGSLLFELAYTAARTGEQGTAWRHWEQASHVAGKLPSDYYHPMTSFSRVIMPAHAVTVAVELRQGGESLRQASSALKTAIPSQPRHGRHLIECARAYQLDNDLIGALQVLKDAHRTAPETIRYNGFARRIIVEASEGPPEIRSRAQDLADVIGITT